MRKHISDIINQDFKNWQKGNLIFINAGTGTGKTFFIKNELSTYCTETGKNILYLTNRDNLKNQIKNDIKGSNTITVMNYQRIESLILNNISFNNYDYVVMDEGHYFFTDASFSRKTDIFFKKMLADNSIIKIIMTATPRILLSYFDKKEIKIDFKYELNTDYSYLDKVVSFNTYESIDNIIQDVPQNEQILLFSNAKRAYEIAKKYKGAFICSEHNKGGYYQYVDAEELNNIIENSEFKSHLLCCTTALDNGINIKENTPVKHIIIDIFDRDEFIQCLGRKRVAEGEKINLYFYSWNDKKRINGFKKKITDSIERAELLIEHGQIEYVKNKFKSDKFYDTRIIDEVIEDNQIKKIVNECIYIKYRTDLLIYNVILGKKYPTTFKSIIALNLGIDKEEIQDVEVKKKIITIEEVFEAAVGKRLFKQDQKKVIEYIGLKDARGRLQKSISQLNAYLVANKLQYIIISKRVKIDNKLNTVWIIEKLIE